MFLETNIFQFFGRFHALIVHLPIGFIIIAIIFEGLAWKKSVNLREAISYALLIGAIAAVFAIILGLMLANDGGYNEEALNLHKWTAISMAALTFLLYFFHKKKPTQIWAKKAYPILMSLVALLLTITGHYGGNLTHGSTYLFEHAPRPIQALAGIKPKRERITNLENALIYEDAISVIFEKKCNVCHNNDKAKGGLLLIDETSILNGGSGGVVVIAGNAEKSELYKRITLDKNHEKFMPTEGRTPLTNEETFLVKWWIDKGLPFDKKIVDLKPSDKITTYLQSIGIGLKKSFLEQLNLPKIPESTTAPLQALGFRINPISNANTVLELSYSPYNKDPLTAAKMDAVLKIKNYITWLNLSNLDLNDTLFSKIGQLENLTELRVSNTTITDNELKHLEPLKHLEYLNVYGNEITDASIESFQKLKNLKKLYLWKTNISEEGILKIKAALPQLTIVTGQ